MLVRRQTVVLNNNGTCVCVPSYNQIFGLFLLGTNILSLKDINIDKKVSLRIFSLWMEQSQTVWILNDWLTDLFVKFAKPTFFPMIIWMLIKWVGLIDINTKRKIVLNGLSQMIWKQFKKFGSTLNVLIDTHLLFQSY